MDSSSTAAAGGSSSWWLCFVLVVSTGQGPVLTTCKCRPADLLLLMEKKGMRSSLCHLSRPAVSPARDVRPIRWPQAPSLARVMEWLRRRRGAVAKGRARQSSLDPAGRVSVTSHNLIPVAGSCRTT